METNAHNDVVSKGPVAVIFRRDAAGNKVAFLQQELDLSVEGGTIKIWHEGKGKETQTVPLSYYHATTKLSDADELDMANKFAAGFVPVFGIQIRKRLGKDLSTHKTFPKSANETLKEPERKPFNQDEYMAKLSITLQAAIKAALEAVNAEYSSTK